MQLCSTKLPIAPINKKGELLYMSFSKYLIIGFSALSLMIAYTSLSFAEDTALKDSVAISPTETSPTEMCTNPAPSTISIEGVTGEPVVKVEDIAADASAQAAPADTDPAQKAYDDAKAKYASRSETTIAPIDEALDILAKAEGTAKTDELNYDILILEARAFYFKGVHSGDDNKTKMLLFNSGQAKADAAEAITQDYSEAPYYAGINLGRWAEANGIIASLTKVSALKAYMNNAISTDRKTRDGKPAATIDGYGPNRVFGRMYQKLPFFAGGSRSKAIDYYTKAVAGAPNLALNTVYLADILIHGGSNADKAEATKKLNQLKVDAQNPAYNPDRILETNEELQMADLLLAGKDIP